MDCPSEENLIRMQLQNIEGIAKQEYDLKDRTLTVFHTGNYQIIEQQLATLSLGSHFIESSETAEGVLTEEDNKQRKVLWLVLAINFGFFLIEMSTGIISKSMGLVADSLDMFADAVVYGPVSYTHLLSVLPTIRAMLISSLQQKGNKCLFSMETLALYP